MKRRDEDYSPYPIAKVSYLQRNNIFKVKELQQFSFSVNNIISSYSI